MTYHDNILVGDFNKTCLSTVCYGDYYSLFFCSEEGT